jgi:hypothetical protein
MTLTRLLILAMAVAVVVISAQTWWALRTGRRPRRRS